MDSAVFLSYVSGMLAVHRLNNLAASVLVAAVTPKSGEQQTKEKSAEADIQMRIAFAFTPLLAVPDTLTPQQIVVTLHNYLEKHPEKWGIQAPLLVTEALEQAFSKK